jgi:hypothetical protein
MFRTGRTHGNFQLADSSFRPECPRRSLLARRMAFWPISKNKSAPAVFFSLVGPFDRLDVEAKGIRDQRFGTGGTAENDSKHHREGLPAHPQAVLEGMLEPSDDECRFRQSLGRDDLDRHGSHPHHCEGSNVAPVFGEDFLATPSDMRTRCASSCAPPADRSRANGHFR